MCFCHINLVSRNLVVNWFSSAYILFNSPVKVRTCTSICKTIVTLDHIQTYLNMDHLSVSHHPMRCLLYNCFLLFLQKQTKKKTTIKTQVRTWHKSMPLENFQKKQNLALKKKPRWWNTYIEWNYQTDSDLSLSPLVALVTSPFPDRVS